MGDTLNKNKNIIYMDTREPKARREAFRDYLIPRCKKGKLTRDNVSKPIDDIKQQALEYGDYMFGDCIFEYKTTRDCLDSIINTKLFEQIDDLSKLGIKSPNLIIVGNINQLLNNPAFRGFYTRALQVLPVHLCPSDIDAFDVMVKTFLTYDDGVGVPKKFFGSNYNTGANFLGCFKSLSFKKGLKIAKHFNITNPRQVLNLTLEDMLEVKGIGKVTAKAFINELNGTCVLDLKEE